MQAIRATLLAGISFSGAAQTGHFDAIQKALGLTAAQVDFLQQRTPPVFQVPQRSGPTAPAHHQPIPHEELTLADFILTDPQIAKLEIVENGANRWMLAYLAIFYGLMSDKEWPWGISHLCPVTIDPSQLSLTESQVQQLEGLRNAPDARKSVGILTDSQRTQLFAFEDALLVEHQAIELQLIPQPILSPGGEVLCH